MNMIWVQAANDITFWNKLNSGIRTYKQWSESNELEKTGGNLAGVLYGGLQSEP